MSYASLEQAAQLEEDARQLDASSWSVESVLKAEDMHEAAQCMRRQVEQSIEHICNFYGLELRIGMRITYRGRPGVLVGFAGQYPTVLIDGETDPDSHHPGEIEFPPEAHVGPGPDERFAHLVEIR